MTKTHTHTHTHTHVKTISCQEDEKEHQRDDPGVSGVFRQSRTKCNKPILLTKFGFRNGVSDFS